MSGGEARIERQVHENLAAVQDNIRAAALRSGRPPESVRLLAVTKNAGMRAIAALLTAGCHEFGESRPQELWRKPAALLQFIGSDARFSSLPAPQWHLIGHLQRNKVARTLPEVLLVHSLDSPRIIEAVAQSARDDNRTIDALLEVNVSGDAAKHGFTAEQIELWLRAQVAPEGVRVRGLMTMASLEGGVEAARRDFAALAALRDRLRDACSAGVTLDELSMGMSGDYEIAIEEGATIVRVGSALFEGLSEEELA